MKTELSPRFQLRGRAVIFRWFVLEKPLLSVTFCSDTMFCVHWARLSSLPKDTGLCIGLLSVFAALQQSTLWNQSFSRQTESKDGWFEMLHIWCHRWCSLGRWGHAEVQFEMLLLSFIRPPHFLVSCLINECSTRLFPAAWAPANCSPAALHHMNPPLAKRWRFTVCWLWTSTPLKVREHFD